MKLRLSLVMVLGWLGISQAYACPAQIAARGSQYQVTVTALGDACQPGVMRVEVVFRNGQRQQWITQRNGVLDKLWIDKLAGPSESLILTYTSPITPHTEPMMVWSNQQGWLANQFVEAPAGAPTFDDDTLIYVRWHQLIWQQKQGKNWQQWQYQPATRKWLKK